MDETSLRVLSAQLIFDPDCAASIQALQRERASKVASAG
jgi:hypothetical protein